MLILLVMIVFGAAAFASVSNLFNNDLHWFSRIVSAFSILPLCWHFGYLFVNARSVFSNDFQFGAIPSLLGGLCLLIYIMDTGKNEPKRKVVY